jgi:hypothetical protein
MAVPALLYESKYCTIRNRVIQKLNTAEMRFIRSVNGSTKLGKIRNENIMEK